MITFVHGLRRRWYAPGRVVVDPAGGHRVVAGVYYGRWVGPGGPWVLTYPAADDGRAYVGVWHAVHDLDSLTRLGGVEAGERR